MRPHTAPRSLAYLREWLVLALVTLWLVGLASNHASLQRLDYLVQDLGARLLARPASPDIVLVAIDDRSLSAIGRWPWRRALHAELLDQIMRQHPRAIGMDILLGEADADYPADDALLARALERSARVVLPVARRENSSIADADLPLALFRKAASQLGHVQMQVDADGLVRSYFELEGPTDAPWPSFTTALRCAGGEEGLHCQGHALPPAGPWTRSALHQLTFARGASPFATYSYLDVLTGKIEPDAFTGKYVLIGATATGLGDEYATPAASGSERIAGVELLAHALNTELVGPSVAAAGNHLNTACNVAIVAAALLGLWPLGPLGSLLACTSLWLLTLILAWLAPTVIGVQFAPAPALAGIIAVYPLWSWRRLSFAAHFLQRELTALRADGVAMPAQASHAGLRPDRLAQRIQAVESASGELRALHHFITNSLEHLPSPTFVCDDNGRITLATQAAHVFALGQQPLQHRPLTEVLSTLVRPDTGLALLPAWPPQTEPRSALREGRDGTGRRWLMLANTFTQEAVRYWLISLIDLTEMRRAQEQRDRALHFISHDIRSPASSILTLLEMQQTLPDPLPESELLTRIARHAQAALTMARDFSQLASAQSRELRRTALDLAILLQEAAQQAWAMAHQKGVEITITSLPPEAPCEGDRELLGRAIDNLLGNAIKFSPSGTQVGCSLHAQAGQWELAVQDEGPGIAPDQQHQVFEPFLQLQQGPGKAEGFGLGLAFVYEVMHRHQGEVRLCSDGLHGSTFTLVLPMVQPASA